MLAFSPMSVWEKVGQLRGSGRDIGRDPDSGFQTFGQQQKECSGDPLAQDDQCGSVVRAEGGDGTLGGDINNYMYLFIPTIHYNDSDDYYSLMNFRLWGNGQNWGYNPSDYGVWEYLT